LASRATKQMPPLEDSPLGGAAGRHIAALRLACVAELHGTHRATTLHRPAAPREGEI